MLEKVATDLISVVILIVFALSTLAAIEGWRCGTNKQILYPTLV